MILKDKTITQGFITSGLMNMSVIVFSRFFTNPTIPKFDADVMSNFGLLMIVVWGLAYIAVAKEFHQLKWLVAVFALEKLSYVINWSQWMFNNSFLEVYNEDKMAGVFYAIYGINDFTFFIFFLFVSINLFRRS